MCSASFAAVSLDNARNEAEIIAQKNANISGVPNPTPLVGGDTIATAANIPALPYSDSGNTCAYADDYEEVCPYTSTSGDVVYAYTPGANASIDISLCDSAYDTKVFVYENNEFTPWACNDDACGSDGFRSELTGVPVNAGNTYYIVVDGYSGACGDYILDITENVPCIVDCPPGAFAEGEVDCYDDYDDVYNSGCNSPTVPVFTAVPCDQTGGGVTVCGTTGVFNHYSGFTYRDTDWYSISAASNTGGTVWCVTGEYSTLSGFLDATAGCGAPVFVQSQVTNPCDTACFNLPAGDLWLFVSTSAWDLLAMPCAGNYTMTLDGYYCGPVSVEASSWSKIKASYR
jgi:hypothetical protein